jgi:hypothetical protein
MFDSIIELTSDEQQAAELSKRLMHHDARGKPVTVVAVDAASPDKLHNEWMETVCVALASGKSVSKEKDVSWLVVERMQPAKIDAVTVSTDSARQPPPPKAVPAPGDRKPEARATSEPVPPSAREPRNVIDDNGLTPPPEIHSAPSRP